VETRFFPRVLLELTVEDGNINTVFFPRRYGDTFEEADLVVINTRQTQYYLLYNGKSSVSNTLILKMVQ
jgi:protein involved in temperature-dependent protein secretion